MKTVRVKIAVAVDSAGNWHATGWSRDGKPAEDAMGVAIGGIGAGERRCWVEADIPMPGIQVIEKPYRIKVEGTVTEAKK